MSGPVHPAPWRWTEDERGPVEDPVEDEKPLILVDANGETLIGVDDMSEPYPFVNVASPRVRALTETSPQLELMVSRLSIFLAERVQHTGKNLPRCPLCNHLGPRDVMNDGLGSHEPDCLMPTFIRETRALLAQIEERSRG